MKPIKINGFKNIQFADVSAYEIESCIENAIQKYSKSIAKDIESQMTSEIQDHLSSLHAGLIIKDDQLSISIKSIFDDDVNEEIDIKEFWPISICTDGELDCTGEGNIDKLKILSNHLRDVAKFIDQSIQDAGK